jgi:hypothetical protein
MLSSFFDLTENTVRQHSQPNSLGNQGVMTKLSIWLMMDSGVVPHKVLKSLQSTQSVEPLIGPTYLRFRHPRR